MANADVIRSWVNCRMAASGNLRTDGKNLWSYSLLIGKTTDNFSKVVIDYTGSNRRSVTTSRHVNLAKIAGADTMQPEQVED